MNKNYKELWLEMYKMTQEQRTAYICSVLDAKNIPYTETNGNIYSIRYSNEPIFVAHLDTVCDADMSKQLLIDPIKNALYRNGGILGADDIAGCAIIMNHAEEINFALFRDEEIGGIGSSEMAIDKDFLAIVEDFNGTCFIELDRMNSGDIIGFENYYCDYDLEEAIMRVLTTYKPARGVWTDIDNINHIRPGVNLSVGYYRQHSKDEYLIIDEFLYINSKIIELKNALKNNFNEAPTYIYGSSSSLYNTYKFSLTTNMIDYLEQKFGLNRKDIEMLGYDFFDEEGMLDEYYMLDERYYDDLCESELKRAYGYDDWDGMRF